MCWKHCFQFKWQPLLWSHLWTSEARFLDCEGKPENPCMHEENMTNSTQESQTQEALTTVPPCSWIKCILFEFSFIQQKKHTCSNHSDMFTLNGKYPGSICESWILILKLNRITTEVTIHSRNCTARSIKIFNCVLQCVYLFLWWSTTIHQRYSMRHKSTHLHDWKEELRRITFLFYSMSAPILMPKVPHDNIFLIKRFPRGELVIRKRPAAGWGAS